jgi:hypothetical protein
VRRRYAQDEFTPLSLALSREERGDVLFENRENL